MEPCTGDFLRRRAAARQHRPRLCGRLPDPAARRADGLARRREPPHRHRHHSRSESAAARRSSASSTIRKCATPSPTASSKFWPIKGAQRERFTRPDQCQDHPSRRDGRGHRPYRPWPYRRYRRGCELGRRRDRLQWRLSDARYCRPTYRQPGEACHAAPGRAFQHRAGGDGA